MSDTIDDEIDGGERPTNGAAVSDEDIRGLLTKERAARQRLQGELEQERAGRTRAETQVAQGASARLEAEEAAVAARLDAAESEAKSLVRTYSEAMSEGRYDDAAELQRKIARNEARSAQDEQYKVYLAGEKTRAEHSARQPQPQASDGGVDLSTFSSKQRAWIREHPEFMDDPATRARAAAGHNLAMAEGVAVDTPEYFDIITETVEAGANRGRRRETEDNDREPPMRRQATDMPVTRRTQSTEGSDTRRPIRLSADQREAADVTIGTDVPVDGWRGQDGRWNPGRYERYATQLARLKAQGRV